MFQGESVGDRLLIIQCESGHKYTDLIACAQYHVLDERTQALASKSRYITHVVFIISLSRTQRGTNFVGFQGGMWDCYYMDSLLPPENPLFTIKDAMCIPISDILSDCYNNSTELLLNRLQNWISLPLLHSSNAQIEQTVLDRFNFLSQLVKGVQVSSDTQRSQNQSTDQNLHKQTCKLIRYVSM